MSKLKAAIVTMFLGTSTAAMASPTVSFNADAQLSWGTGFAMPTVRDHRTSDYGYQMPTTRSSWISLASSLDLSRGRDVIRLQAGNITQIRLQAVSGATFIDTVTVVFRDGSRQTVELNEYLSRRNPMLQFDIQGRRRSTIDALIIEGESVRRGSYEVFAQGTQAVEQPPVYQPPVYQPPVYQPPVYQPPVYQPPVYQPQVQNPVLLTSELTFANTQGYRLVYVTPQAGMFSMLRVQAHAGELQLSKIQVTFTNGQTQTFSGINRLLMAGQNVELRLDPRGEGRIAQMYVYANDTLTAMPNVITGSFDITGL